MDAGDELAPNTFQSDDSPEIPTREAWRGVNLGGWLLLEPGPAADLFSRHIDADNDPAEIPACEWKQMEVLRKKNAVSDLRDHREKHITREDFARIKACGLNSVRLPFGYWIVTGPSPGEPYEGPALEYIDRAIDWAEEFGLQVLLDLHGCPGGESGDAPCGHHQRPVGVWHWSDWNFWESLKVLETVAKRYQGRRAVTGISVCNEPSSRVPLSKLCTYYYQAVKTIRANGMHADQVTVVLPAFQRPVKDVASVWNHVSRGECRNVCFDLHYYHCFGPHFNKMTLAQNLREVEVHASELLQFPAVVSEWSLALGSVARRPEDPQTRAIFAAAQMTAYENASHGWFFWTWKDAAGIDWDFRQSHAEGSLQQSQLPRLPSWSGCGEDPLEELLSPCGPKPDIHLGDDVFLRSFRGTYLDVEGSAVQARWDDPGEWQRIKLCRADDSESSSVAESSDDSGSESASESVSGSLSDGDVVRLKAHTGDYLGVSEVGLSAYSNSVNSLKSEFIVRVKRGGPNLRHRSVLFLECKATGQVVDCDVEDNMVRARWSDFGEWQGFVVEKAGLQDNPSQNSPLPILGCNSRSDKRADCWTYSQERNAENNVDSPPCEIRVERNTILWETPPRKANADAAIDELAAPLTPLLCRKRPVPLDAEYPSPRKPRHLSDSDFEV